MTHESSDASVLRRAGLTSVAGGLLFIFVFAWVIVFAGPEPAGVDGPIARFPEIEAIRIVENGLYLAVLALWVPTYLALYRGLRRQRPASALFGGALGVLGLGVFAAGAIPHAATSRLSDLYHAAGATSDDRRTLALVWHGVQGIFDALVLTGLLVTAAAVVVLGLAMRAVPAFGTPTAWLSTSFGATAAGAGMFALIEPTSPVAALGVITLIFFHLSIGWRMYRLSAMESAPTP